MYGNVVSARLARKENSPEYVAVMLRGVAETSWQLLLLLGIW